MPRDTSWSVVLRPTSPATALRLQRDSLANEAKRLELTAGGVDQAQRQAIEAEISERERAYEDRVKQIKSDSSSRDLEYKQTITLPSAAPIAETPAPGAAAPPSLPSAAEVELRKQGRYVLLPVAPFQALSVLVDSFTRAAKPSIEPYGVADASNLGPQQVAAESGVELRVRLRGRIVALVDSIQQLLQYQYGFRGFQELTEAEIDGVIDRMRYWNMDMVSANNGTIGAYRGQVWRDREFRSRPSAIFKRYLYRPSTNAIRNLGDGLNLLTFNHVVSFGTEGSNEVMVGAVLPTVRSSLSIPGVIEMQVGLARKNFWSVPEAENFALAFTYDRHYKATIAWYSRLSWVNNRRSIEGDNDASNLGLGLGASIMPFWPFSDKVHGISKRLKTRVGVRIDWRDVQPNLHRLELQTTFYYR